MNFVTECLDSKLVPLGSENTKEAHDCFFRLRLHFMVRILLGDTIIIPQGWALDSVCALAVGSEIKRCLDHLKGGQFEKRYVAGISPFRMEYHLPGDDYLTVLTQYLKRDDCIWSGLPVLRDEDARRRMLMGIEAMQSRGRFEFDAFASSANRALNNDHVSHAWADIAQYFSDNPRDRLLRVTWNSNHYARNIQTGLSALDQLETNNPITLEVIHQIKQFKKRVETRRHIIASVSTLLAHVESEYDEGAKYAIEHISNFSQIRSVAEVTQSDASAPSISALSHNGVLIGDSLLQSAFSSALPSGLLIEQNLTSHPQLVDKINKADWMNLWGDIVMLSRDASWLGLVSEFKGARQIGDADRSRRALDSMEKLLAKNVPALALEISGIEKLGLRLTDAGWSKIFGKGVGYGFGFGAGALLAAISVPTTLVVGAGVTAAWLGEGLLAPKIDPFRGGKFSSHATIFRLVR